MPKSEIEEKSFSPVSVMPNGLSDGMTLQDFADVIAFLEARKEKKVVNHKGHKERRERQNQLK